MKKEILLIENSQTVQKVVALTVDKRNYEVTYCNSYGEAHKYLQQQMPDLVLVGDQVPDLNLKAFPLELKSLAKDAAPPAIVISGTDRPEHRIYTSVLKKPFTPGQFTSLIEEYARPIEAESPSFRTGEPSLTSPGREPANLENLFNQTFADEADLMEETLTPRAGNATFGSNQPQQNAPSGGGLWGPGPSSTPNQIPVHPSVHYAPSQAHVQVPAPAPSADLRGSTLPQDSLASMVERQIGQAELTQAVDSVLAKLVPPIVERLVKERLDALLKEQAGLEIK